MSVELVNPDIDRVDAVNGPATGIPFLMFKSAEGGPAAAPAEEEAPAEVAKSEEPAAEEAPVEEPAAEVAKSEEAPAEAEAPAEEVAKSEDAPAEDAPVEVAKSEAEDADKAAKAAKTLAALRQVVKDLAQSEAAEEDYSADAFDLMDAGAAIDYALGILAKFALTEAVDASTVEKDAGALRKALHIEVHEHKPEEAAPAEAPAMAEAPVDAPAEAPAEEHPPVAKAADGVLPSGLMELLSTFVESYSQFMDAQQSGAEEELNAEDADAAPAAAPAEAPKEAAPAPAEAAPAPAAPEAHAAPAEPAHAPVAAPAEHAPAAAPKAPEEDPADKLKKSMEDAIAEAVAKATEPLLKQIDVLERTPVDSGPMLAGQTPDNAGEPLVRGQEGGAVAKGLTSAPAQAAPGITNALADGIKSLYKGAF